MAKMEATTPISGAPSDTAAPSVSRSPTPPAAPSTPSKKHVEKPETTTVSSLIVSRNKNWKYLSAFKGAWLQLPVELLELLAHNNYLAARPRQTDPGVLFDIVKIRKLVDDASDLAVRAQNGTASSALAARDTGFPGDDLGLSYRRPGTNNNANNKLSPERKYRMRELATQKLAQAYRLDEVAASVAAMQSFSVLEGVAALVLQRSPENADAKYVHFFHEKIPLRMVSECTPLGPLNDMIAAAPGHAAAFRTRALTKIFKEDHLGAIQDLTEGLSLSKLKQAKHTSTPNQLDPLKLAKEEAEKSKISLKDWMAQNKVPDEDQPKGIELQLLFHRGNQYLALACQHIRPALDGFRLASIEQQEVNESSDVDSGGFTSDSVANERRETYQQAVEAREAVRKNAKKAIRDFTTFFSHLDYAHTTNRPKDERSINSDATTDELEDFKTPSSNFVAKDQQPKPELSSALVPCPQTHGNSEHPPKSYDSHQSSTFLTKVVYEISALFSSSPPADLPPFPRLKSDSGLNTFSHADHHSRILEHDEMVTYHPLLHETLHSLLLAHCLLQTPTTALLRLAHNVARILHLADDDPYFRSGRSQARIDWTEILRNTKNWISLGDTWDSICKPSELLGAGHPAFADNCGSFKVVFRGPDMSRNEFTIPFNRQIAQGPETFEQKRDRIHKEAMLEAAGDERVMDDETFTRAVKAIEMRAWDDEEHGNSTQAKTDGCSSKGRDSGSVVTKGDEFVIATERAEAIAKWIMEAPKVVDTGKPKKAKRKAAPKMRHEGFGGHTDSAHPECRE